MRYERHKWNDVDITAEIVVAGVGVGGLAPTIAIQRKSDSQWLQAGGGSWGAGFAVNNMVEPDAVNLIGLYNYAIPTARLDATAGAAGYLVEINEATIPANEFMYAAIDYTPTEIATQVWNTDVPALVTANQNLACFMLTWIRNAVINTEDATRHVANAPHVAGTRFYCATCPPPAARSASFAGRLAAFHDADTGQVELVRVASLGNDGADYIEITMLDGTSGMPDEIEINDELVILNANDPMVSEIMSEPMAAYGTDGTFGDWIRRMLSLRQQNVRVLWTTWNAAGVPTDGRVLIYDSKADLQADAGPGWALATGDYAIVQTFDGSGRPTAYTSVKDA